MSTPQPIFNQEKIVTVETALFDFFNTRALNNQAPATYQILYKERPLITPALPLDADFRPRIYAQRDLIFTFRHWASQHPDYSKLSLKEPTSGFQANSPSSLLGSINASVSKQMFQLKFFEKPFVNAIQTPLGAQLGIIAVNAPRLHIISPANVEHCTQNLVDSQNKDTKQKLQNWNHPFWHIFGVNNQMSYLFMLPNESIEEFKMPTKVKEKN